MSFSRKMNRNRVNRVLREQGDVWCCDSCSQNDGWMYLHSKCHRGSPTWIRVKGNTLVIECSECRKVITTMLLQQTN